MRSQLNVNAKKFGVYLDRQLKAAKSTFVEASQYINIIKSTCSSTSVKVVKTANKNPTTTTISRRA